MECKKKKKSPMKIYNWHVEVMFIKKQIIWFSRKIILIPPSRIAHSFAHINNLTKFGTKNEIIYVRHSNMQC